MKITILISALIASVFSADCLATVRRKIPTISKEEMVCANCGYNECRKLPLAT